MLSSSDKNKLIDKINTAFSNIGKSNGTRLPTSSNNRDPIAWDLFVAQHVTSLANKRKEAAERAAVRAGVINDKEKDPRPAGTKDMIYSGEQMAVLLSVNTAAERINAAKVYDYLLDHGVDADLLNKAMLQATTHARPPHVYSAYILTADTE
jgi:hypothetical protein